MSHNDLMVALTIGVPLLIFLAVVLWPTPSDESPDHGPGEREW